MPQIQESVERGWSLSYLLAGDPSEEELASRMLVEVTELIDCDAVGLRWLDPRLGFRDALIVREQAFSSTIGGFRALPVADGAWRAFPGTPNLEDVSPQPQWRLSHHLLGPLSAGSTAWARLHLHRRAEAPEWTDEELSHFRSYCLSRALVVENQLMQSLLKREVEALRNLAAAGERWHEQRDAKAILESGLNQALALTGFSHGVAFLDDEDSGELRPVVGLGMGVEAWEKLKEAPLSPYQHASLLRSLRQCGLAVSDLEAHPALAACLPQRPKSFVCLPLNDGKHFEGALVLADALPMGHAAARLVQAVGPVLAGQLAHTLRGTALFKSLALKSKDLQRATEALVQAERRATLVKLAAAVAHQIRNPLSVVSAHVDLLNEGLRPEDPMRQTLDLVSFKVGEANAIIQQLLELSRPLALTLRPHAIAAVLSSFKRFVEPKCRQQGVVLECDVPEGLPAAWMDETHLQRCLLDLCLNSLQFLKRGQRLRIWAQASAGWVTLSVDDDGPGIPSSIQPQLFEPFNSGRVGGTGMGLFNVKRICVEMGGLVVAGNRAEGGCRFSIHMHDANSPNPQQETGPQEDLS